MRWFCFLHLILASDPSFLIGGRNLSSFLLLSNLTLLFIKIVFIVKFHCFTISCFEQCFMLSWINFISCRTIWVLGAKHLVCMQRKENAKTNCKKKKKKKKIQIIKKRRFPAEDLFYIISMTVIERKMIRILREIEKRH